MKSKIVIWGLLLVLIASGFAGFTTHGTQENHPSTRDLNSGLVAYWDFDDGSGNILHDKSGNGNDGTIYNATWVKGVSGDALSFDGVDSYVEVKSNKNLAPVTYTVNIWFKPHNPTYLSGDEEIITKGINKLYYQIQWGGEYANDDNEVEFWYEDQYDSDYYLYSNPVKVGAWHMATMVYSEGKLTVYVDGTYVAENQFDVSPYDSGEDLYIGHGDSGYFNGTIDEARIYNRLLSSEEVKGLYYQYVPKSPGNLQASMGRKWIDIRWDKPENANTVGLSGYDVYRSMDGVNYEKIGEVSNEKFNDKNVVEGRTYYYYVVGKNANGVEGNKSENLKVNFVLPPISPGNVNANYEDEKVVVSWNAPNDDGGAGIDGYTVYRSEDGVHYEKIGVTSSDTRVYYDSNVEGGKTYYYYVTAANRVGESDKSNEVSISIPGFPWIWLIIALIVIGAVIGIVIAMMKRKKRENVQSIPPSEGGGFQKVSEQQLQPLSQPHQSAQAGMITVTCPYCGFTSQVPQNMRGQWVKCPKCGNQFQIP